MDRPFARRVAAVAALLLVGLALSSAFSASVTGFQTEYAAEPVDPVADAPDIATHTPAVLDLDSRLAEFSARDRRAVENATDGPPVRVLEPNAALSQLPDDDIEYAVLHDRYYRANVTYLHDPDGVGRSNFSLAMNFTRVPTETAMNDLAVDYANATPGVQHIVDTGTGTNDGNLTTTTLVDTDGTYYLVTVENGGELFSTIFLAAVSIPLGMTGRAYLAAGVPLGVLLLQTGVPRPLTYRRAFGVTAATLPLGLLAAATLTAPLTLGRVLGRGVLVLPFTCALPAGTALAHRNWGRAALATLAAGALLATAAVLAALSSPFLAAVVLALGAFTVPIGGVTLLGFGYWLAD